MKVKSPHDPIIVSEESYSTLESILKKNECRSELTKSEKALLEGSKNFDDKVRVLINE